MAFIKGRERQSARLRNEIPEHLERVARGAARAGASVFADYVKENTPSDEVRGAVRIRTKADDSQVKVTVDLKPGWARTLGNWLEWGTSPHFISVDDSQRSGRSVGRINRLVAENDGNHSLVIGGNFVGSTVWHPGAQAHPVFRPARDLREAEAIAAAQNYINVRIGRPGIDEGDSE